MKFKQVFLIIILLGAILGTTILTPHYLIDYLVSHFFLPFKMFKLLNYIHSWIPLYPIFSLLSLINLYPYILQIFTFAAMLISFNYIKKLTSHYYIASIIFIINPFLYFRIITGQFGIIVSYLLLPLTLYTTQQLFKEKLSSKSIAKYLIIITLSSIFSIQFFVLNGIIFLIIFIQNIAKSNYKIYLKKCILIAILLILLNLYWVYGFFTSSDIMSQINEHHEQFFSPKPTGDISPTAKILGGFGFWREQAYLTSYQTFPHSIWYIITLLFPLLLILGYQKEQNRKQANLLLSLFLIGLILAIGISHPYTKPLFDYLFNNLPLFNGFRDSHKFVSLIFLAYALLIPNAIQSIRKKFFYYGIPVIFVAIILIYNYPMINLGGQYKEVILPTSYEETNQFLNNQNITGEIITVPYELYLTYNWSTGVGDGRIPNIYYTLDKIILSPTDTYGEITSTQKSIQTCIKNKDIKCLENQGVEYILKDKCAKYPDNFNWINTTPILENECTTIYKINPKFPKETKQMPISFAIALAISAITLLILLRIIYHKEN